MSSFEIALSPISCTAAHAAYPPNANHSGHLAKWRAWRPSAGIPFQEHLFKAGASMPWLRLLQQGFHKTLNVPCDAAWWRMHTVSLLHHAACQGKFYCMWKLSLLKTSVRHSWLCKTIILGTVFQDTVFLGRWDAVDHKRKLREQSSVRRFPCGYDTCGYGPVQILDDIAADSAKAQLWGGPA